MGKSGEKKKNVQNQKIVSTHLTISGVIYALFILYRVFYHWSSFHFVQCFFFVVSSLGFFFSMRSIKNSAVPYEDDKGNLTVLTDLSSVSGSLTEYLFDIVYVQWVILVIGLFTDYAWWLWTAVPLFATYKLVSFGLPFLRGGGIPGMPGMAGLGGAGLGGSGDQDTSHLSPLERKKLEKKQRKEGKFNIKNNNNNNNNFFLLFLLNVHNRESFMVVTFYFFGPYLGLILIYRFTTKENEECAHVENTAIISSLLLMVILVVLEEKVRYSSESSDYVHSFIMSFNKGK